jgi:hypothetical protein
MRRALWSSSGHSPPNENVMQHQFLVLRSVLHSSLFFWEHPSVICPLGLVHIAPAPYVATLPTSAIHCGPQAAQGKGELGALGTLTNHVYLILTESGRLASAACLCTFAQQLHNAAVTFHRDSFTTTREAGMVAFFFFARGIALWLHSAD